MTLDAIDRPLENVVFSFELEELLEWLNLEGAEIRCVSETWAETLVRFLTHPVVSSLLMIIGILGTIIELRSPGFGIPGILGIAFLALLFWGHWLVQLAGWEDLLLVGIGLFLLALEIFVSPGFGIAGLLGIGALLSGLSMSLVGAGATWNVILAAAGRVGFSLLFALVGSLLFFRFLPRLPFGQKLILDTELPAEAGYASAPDSNWQWLHKSGTAISALRPAGIASMVSGWMRCPTARLIPEFRSW